jgi:cytochrome P450
MTDTNTEHRCPVGDLAVGYNPFAEPQLSEPFAIWEQARQKCPVFYSEQLGAWVVARYDDVVEVLGDFQTFSSVGASRGFSELTPEAQAVLATVPPPSQTDVVPTDPPRHTKMRRFIQLSFLPKRIADLEPRIRTIANELIDTFEPHGNCDFYRDFAYLYPLSVVTSLVGIPAEDLPRIKHWVECSLSLKWGRLDPATQLAAAEGRKEYFEYLVEFVGARRGDDDDSFVAALVAHSEQSDDPLTETELVGQISTLMSAGHETTANFLTLSMDAFLTDRAIWDSIVADPSRIPAVIEESLRLNGPVQSLWRTTTKESALAGVDIPAGARISALTASGNRDDAMFEHAAAFDLDRANTRKHIAFGRGIHSCAGSNLARMEVRIALEILSQRLPSLRRAQRGPLQFEPSALQRAPKELQLAWN